MAPAVGRFQRCVMRHSPPSLKVVVKGWTEGGDEAWPVAAGLGRDKSELKQTETVLVHGWVNPFGGTGAK